MRILFVGIYDLGRMALDSLANTGVELAGIVTKPSGGNERQPVAEWAIRHHVPLLEPVTPKTPEFLEQVRKLAPDLLVVAGYHRVIPASVLEVPPRGAINVHGSLLPGYRGPSPWKDAIAAGETHTGVTVHVMTPQLDNGDILAQTKIPIDDEDTGGSLFHKICIAGAELLAETIQRMKAGPIARTPQDPALASYFGYPGEEQTRISWSASADQIRRLVRAMSPRPGAWTRVEGKRWRVWHVTPCAHETNNAEPGTVLSVFDHSVKVATGSYPLIVDQASLDGQPISDWPSSGFRLQVDDRLDAEGYACDTIRAPA